MLASVSLSASAETLSALAGFTAADGRPSSSYGWQLEFEEPWSARFSGSLSWLNEGHIPRHRRDGAATQFWLDAPAWHSAIYFSLGVGPYVYFDTQTSASSRGYSDFHGAGALITGAVTVTTQTPWYLRINLHGIYAPSDISTFAVLVGGGYRFAAPSGDDARIVYRPQQVQVFGGEMIFSDQTSRQARSLGLDYRFEFSDWLAVSATWFDDPASAGGRHDRIAGQLWLNDDVAGGSLALSAGLGVYAALGPPPARATTGRDDVSGLSALRAEWRATRRSSLILTWYRTFTNDDSDRDIITLGYGFRFGGL